MFFSLFLLSSISFRGRADLVYGIFVIGHDSVSLVTYIKDDLLDKFVVLLPIYTQGCCAKFVVQSIGR